MKNPAIFYAAIVLGVIGLAAGVYMLTANYHGRAYAVLALGAVLLIGGVAGMFMARPKSTAR
jgi:uncharacterized membrane protein HdeD (DUF308 family)